jgi:hypothetical protein
MSAHAAALLDGPARSSLRTAKLRSIAFGRMTEEDFHQRSWPR